MHKIGLLVNPIAGMGGSVGLKGTDGLAEEAARRGAAKRAPLRAEAALLALRPLREDLQVLCAARDMGADEAGAKSVADIADVMMPHLGANTKEANFTAAKRAGEDLAAYFEQGERIYVVNK